MSKGRVFDVAGVLGIFVIWASAYFFESWSGIWFWVCMSVGAVLGYLGAYGGLANKFGLHPFTKDPLGWREAKKSYRSRKDEKSR